MIEYRLCCNHPVLSEKNQRLTIYLQKKTGWFKKETIGHAILNIKKDNGESIILDDYRLDTVSDEWE